MKIAVYTICKNEAQFIKRWIDSAKDADVLVITDTGSSDNTYSLLQNYAKQNLKLLVNQTNIRPWRFDDARNFNLMSIPEDVDICICLDMDEILTPGWRTVVEDAWQKNSLDRLRYNYIWSWNNGKPGVTYYADKIHVRHGMRWVNPVHEVLHKDARLSPEKQVFIDATLIEHHPDLNKSRSQYLPLLELATKERPYDDRNAHYYARELMFDGQYERAIVEFNRHLALPTALWKSERSASMRYLGDCHWAMLQRDVAMKWFRDAVAEAPGEREPLTSLAQGYRALGLNKLVINTCNRILVIKEKPNSYINQESSWNGWPEQMLKEAIINAERADSDIEAYTKECAAG